MSPQTREQREVLFWSANDAAGALRARKISSRELTEALLARIEELNPALNAVVELRGDAALAEASAADEAISRGVAGPLQAATTPTARAARPALSIRDRVPRDMGAPLSSIVDNFA